MPPGYRKSPPNRAFRQVSHLDTTNTDSWHRCPLQCGTAAFNTTKEGTNENASENLLFTSLGSLSLSDDPTHVPSHTPTMSKPDPMECPLLALPGEIRNRIYFYVLLRPKPFAVRLQFAPLDTALLRVNRSVFKEASNIFYYENTFRIPESLFLGAPILQQLETLYHVPPWRLKSMKRFIFEIPVCTLCEYPHSSQQSLC